MNERNDSIYFSLAPNLTHFKRKHPIYPKENKYSE